MRAPNGYGTIYKLPGKRRKPWAFRVTTGYRENKSGGLSPIVEYVGFYESQRKAFQARDEYNKKKHADYIPTFDELADAFEAEHFPECSPRTVTIYETARRKCAELAFTPVDGIRYTDLQEIINACSKGSQGVLRAYIKLVFDYAYQREEKSTIHYRYTADEIARIKGHADNKEIAFVLLTIYTGMRPGELRQATEFKDGCIVVKSGKTENAARLVPVHPDAVRLLEYFPFGDIKEKDVARALDRAGVLDYVHPDTGNKQKHKLHDGRHTFTSNWKEQKLDDGILHLFGGIGLREVLPELFTLESHPLQVSLFDFSQDILHGFQGTSSFLAEFFQSLCLGEGGGCLRVIHGFDDMLLFLGRQIGQLDSRIKGDLLLIDHVQQFRDQIGETDKALNIPCTITCLIS